MALINTRVINIDLSQIVHELKRLNSNLEQIYQINAPTVEPGRDFNPDDYSSVLYTSEEDELVSEQISKNSIGR